MYVERHNDKSAIIFERFNGEDIKKGEEVFSKIKIKNNIEKIKWDTLNNWIYKTENKKEINNNLKEYAHNLIKEQKFLYLNLKDGTEVELSFFEDGYVFYN